MTMQKKGWLEDIHPSGKLFATAGVALLFGIFITLAGLLLALPFFGEKAALMMQGGVDLTHPDNIMLGKYLQIISHLGLFILSSLLLAWLFSRNIREFLYMRNSPRLEVYFLSAVLIFAAVPLINFILELNMQMHLPDALKPLEDWMRRSEEAAEKTTRAFLSVDSLQGLLFNIFMIAVIPAIGEELMFRGIILRVFKQWSKNAHLAVWISAIIFSAIHLQFFGFFPRLILGALFGYMVIWTGSIWPAMIAHFINNAAAVISFHLFQHQLSGDTLENIGKGSDGIYFALTSLIITVSILWVIKKAGNRGKTSTMNPQQNGL